MRTMKELDKRQRAVVKVIRSVDQPGECKLDILMQTANFAGLSTALRQEEQNAFDDDKGVAVCLIECAKRGIYLGMKDSARRFGTTGTNYMESTRNLIRTLTKRGTARTGRPVCILFDHAGNVPVEVLETVFRAADDTAYREEISVRMMFVITKVHVWDVHKRLYTAQFKKENELLKPRWRTWDYGAKEFTLLKAAAKFQPVGNEAPLLDGASDENAEQSRVLKLA